MSAINLLNFNVLIDDQQYVFSPKKTLTKTKYKCQGKRKSRNSKFYINSVKDLSSASHRKSDHATFL